MKEAKVIIILTKRLFEQLRVLLGEIGSLHLVVGNSLSLFLGGLLCAIYGIWMLDDHAQPLIGLNLLYEVGKLQSRYAINRIVLRRKRLEEGDNTFRNTGLFPPFVNVN